MSKKDYLQDININTEYVTNKEIVMRDDISYMLSRTNSMFQYTGLPDTISHRVLELQLQKYGKVFVTEINNDLYALTGTLGGELDENSEPTLFTVNNIALKINKNYDIKSDGILLRNDSLCVGLMPMLYKYTSLLSENLLTIRTATIILRMVTLISASEDKTKKSADLFIENLIKGKLSSIGESAFFDGIKVHSSGTNNSSYIQQFIELQQYLKASLFNELGLNANYNMKREAIGGNEAALNEDFLLPFCDDMLRNRKLALKNINSKYGTDIKVDYDSSWKINQKEIDIQLKEKSESK